MREKEEVIIMLRILIEINLLCLQNGERTLIRTLDILCLFVVIQEVEVIERSEFLKCRANNARILNK